MPLKLIDQKVPLESFQYILFKKEKKNHVDNSNKTTSYSSFHQANIRPFQGLELLPSLQEK